VGEGERQRRRDRAANVISKYTRLSARRATYNFPMAACLPCALTIPRSKCTLMDCIKQRDGRARARAPAEVGGRRVGGLGKGWSEGRGGRVDS